VARLGRNVALLAATSFLADVSGEMLMAVLPFLLVAQGAGGLAVGLVGGFADAIGHLVKPFSGALADRTRRRKPLIISGYLTAAVARIGIALGGAWSVTLAFRSVDRVGKGLRSAPRDALLAESVPPERRGRAFGIHRAADTLGAVVGVSAALVMLVVFGASPAIIVFAGALVGLSTVVPLVFVREIDASHNSGKPLLEAASPRYVRYLVVVGLFALGNVSYLFYLLRAREAVGGDAGAVALYLGFNVVYFAAAYPFGHLADRIGKVPILGAGFALASASAAFFLLPPSLPLAIAGFALLGLSFASVDGVERALAADLAGSAARSTRLGIFSATVGLSTVLGGVVAGLLWQSVAPWATFAWGAVVTLVALGLLGWAAK
jgi:MFS family permease